METLLSTTKRKKRKTRKCLDEIRKRSRRNTDVSDTFLTSPIACKQIEIGSLNGVKPNLNRITSNRLTLPMFPKFIRSETITRPTISDIKMIRQDPEILIKNVVKGKKPPSTVTSNSLKIHTSPNSDSDIRNSDEESIRTVFNKCNEMEPISLRKESDSEHVSNPNGNSPGSFLLFSPMDQAPNTDHFEQSLDGETMSSHTTLSSQSSREDYGYHLYEEFMNEISTNLKESAPALMKEDVIKKTRTILQNMYIEGCRRECENNILQCIKSSVLNHRPCTPRASIMQNPMDYIRLGYAWRQNGSVSRKLIGSVAGDHTNKLSNSMTTNSNGGLSIKLNSSIENSISNNILSTNGSGVAGDECSMPPPDATHPHIRPAPSLIHDTPEYTYYPHKLNQ